MPQFEGLTTDDMLKFSRREPKVAAALPVEPREVDKLRRQYNCNVCYTLIGEPFRQWVDNVMQQCNSKIESERNLAIQMDPEIAKIFQQSTAVRSK